MFSKLETLDRYRRHVKELVNRENPRLFMNSMAYFPTETKKGMIYERNKKKEQMGIK